MNKAELLIKLIESHNEVIKTCFDNYSGDHDITIVPESVHDYTNMFLVKVKEIIFSMSEYDLDIPFRESNLIIKPGESMSKIDIPDVPKDFHTEHKDKL